MTIKEFWETKKELCIHCDTEEKAKKLLTKFHELGKRWCSGKSYLDYTRYDFYEERSVYYNDGHYGNIYCVDKDNCQIIEFDELEDFKPNFFNMFMNLKVVPKLSDLNLNDEQKSIKNLLKAIFGKKARFTINEEKKCVFLQLDGKKVTIKCDKEDKFDWKIGLGLAISNIKDNEKFKAHREFFRNPKTHQLNIKKYAYWVLTEFYHNDMISLHKLELRVKDTPNKEFVEL